ncbi:MAG TPA: hypothetical protein VK176_04145 [Phycisphaerales bacterium]|nr:hypothetical protein [Phycisphaerales bacterium]
MDFETAVHELGWEWISAQTQLGAGVVGAMPVACVISIGCQLRNVLAVENSGNIIRRIKRGELSALAEARAIQFFRDKIENIGLFAEPVVVVNGQNKRPDLLARIGAEEVMIEVARAEDSRVRARIVDKLNCIAALISDIPFGRSAEIYLDREPQAEEIHLLQNGIRNACDSGSGLHEVENLGCIQMDRLQPGVVSPLPKDDIVQVFVAAGEYNGDSNRSILVGCPFEDDRAKSFLNHEAKHFSKEHCNLLVIEIGGSAKSCNRWAPLVARQFHPNQRTRLSGVMIVASHLDPEGFTRFDYRLVRNPFARSPLPDSLLEPLHI